LVFFRGVCNGSCASTGIGAGNGGSKHQLPKLAVYDDWEFASIDYLRSLAIGLALAFALALAIAPPKHWRQLGKG
jgi:hypothetical protein